MGLQIADGRTGETLQILDGGIAKVESRTARKSSFVSRDDGQTYNVNSHDSGAAAGDLIAYWQNTHTSKSLFIDLVRVGGVESALWKVWFVTGTAAGGSAVTPTNMNKQSSNAASANARGDGAITGLSTDGQIANIRTLANNNGTIPFDDTLILGQNDAIAVEYDTGTTGIAEVLIRAHYE